MKEFNVGDKVVVIAFDKADVYHPDGNGTGADVGRAILDGGECTVVSPLKLCGKTHLGRAIELEGCVHGQIKAFNMKDIVQLDAAVVMDAAEFIDKKNKGLI